MTERKEKNLEEVQESVEGNEENLPFCTTAPSAEHLRGEADDEPCDDGRSGD